MPANAGLPLVVGNNLYQCERVLVIPPDANGTLVVSYETDLNAVSPPSVSGSETANFTSDILAPEWSRALTIPEQYSYVNATGVTVTPSIRSVNVTDLGNATTLDVTYTINVSNGVSGFFMLQYLDSCPTMIPLAVGYSASQINASSFPDYQPFLQGCTGLGMLSGGTLMSVSGIQTAWLVQTIQHGNNSSTVNSSSISMGTGETCTPDATISQGSSTETITLCHTVSTTYAPPASSKTATGSSTSSNGTTQPYRVTFQQEGACSPAVYVAPWSVTLGNTTESEPPNMAVSNGGYSAGPEPPSVYTIVFSVPNGTYQYSVHPQGAFYTYSGTVTMNGSDVSIMVNGPVISCTTTTGAG